MVRSYPEKDFSANAGRALAEALRRFGIGHDIKIYPGARHSFFDYRGRASDRDAPEDSWVRTIAFFGKHLAALGETTKAQ